MRRAKACRVVIRCRKQHLNKRWRSCEHSCVRSVPNFGDYFRDPVIVDHGRKSRGKETGTFARPCESSQTKLGTVHSNTGFRESDAVVHEH
jgi:hypothetical protein